MRRNQLPEISSAGKSVVPYRFIILACVLGACYWLIESFAHVFLFHLNELEAALFRPSAEELWMRLTVITILILFGVYAQISSDNRSRIEEKIRQSQTELRNLTGHLQIAREKERKHVAREIHDVLGQGLSVLHLQLAWVLAHMPENEHLLRTKASAIIELVNDISRTVDKISASLRPAILDDLGIAAALEWQVSTFEELTGLVCSLTVAPAEMDPDQETAIVIYRILQESLTNIMRHAQATKVDIAVSEADGLITMIIADDGQGIVPQQGSAGDAFGLIGMRERVNYLGGHFEISGPPGRGTTVTAVLPNSRKR